MTDWTLDRAEQRRRRLRAAGRLAVIVGWTAWMLLIGTYIAGMWR